MEVGDDSAPWSVEQGWVHGGRGLVMIDGQRIGAPCNTKPSRGRNRIAGYRRSRAHNPFKLVRQATPAPSILAQNADGER